MRLAEAEGHRFLCPKAVDPDGWHRAVYPTSRCLDCGRPVYANTTRTYLRRWCADIPNLLIEEEPW